MSMMNHFIFRKIVDGPGYVLAISRAPYTDLSRRLYQHSSSCPGEPYGVGRRSPADRRDVQHRKHGLPSAENFKGYGFYATYDFKYHVGIEGEFHQINDPDSTEGIYERTYEIGPRYVLRYGRYNPYAKLMYGRGIFNYPNLVDGVSNTPTPTANIAYNIGAIGAGLDYRVLIGMNVRAEYEYQQWFGFPPNGLTLRFSALVLPIAFIELISNSYLDVVAFSL